MKRALIQIAVTLLLMFVPFFGAVLIGRLSFVEVPEDYEERAVFVTAGTWAVYFVGALIFKKWYAVITVIVIVAALLAYDSLG